MFAGPDGVLGPGLQKYADKKGDFSQAKFWNEHKGTLPIHAAVFRGDAGCNMGASANVEHVFSNSGDLMSDFHAHSLDPGVMEGYIVIKENWIYPMLRPSLEEIWTAYNATHGGSRAAAAQHDEDEYDSDYDLDARFDISETEPSNEVVVLY
jgi:hypothetical protein